MNETVKGISGWVDLFEVRGGVWLPAGGQPNQITTQGADVMALALAGLRKLNCMYFAYSNGTGVSPLNSSEYNNASTYAAVVSGRGVGRSLAVSAPSFSSSGSGFDGNRITITAMTSGDKLSGEDLLDSVSSVYHVALVSAADDSDASLDMVFSCSDLTVERVKSAGAQIGVRWTLTCSN